MEEHGHKALGLASLPESWSPPYITISQADAVELAGPRGEATESEIAARLQSRLGNRLEGLFDSDRSAGVIVRSSGLEEDISARGLYRSVKAGFPSIATVAEAVSEVWRHARDVSASSAPIPVIVQRLVDPSQLTGHLSNERRLHRESRSWTVEMQGALNEPRSLPLKVSRGDRIPMEEVMLECSGADEIRRVLRKIAGSLTERDSRYHLEWVWDGTRVWVVQCDRVSNPDSLPPSSASAPKAMPDLVAFRPAGDEDLDVPKLRCVSDYRAAGLPHAELWVLHDPKIVASLIRGVYPRPLRTDLEQLAAVDAVIRTDYVRAQDDFEVLLPRTDAGSSADELREFLEAASRNLDTSGVPRKDIVYLCHPFIPAEGAAWALAAPRSSRVRIDATFGLPDGLLYYPHDSYEVDVSSDRVRSQIRCKSPIFVCDEDGTWRARNLGAPWDWRAVLSTAQALEVAQLGKRLADWLNKPVQIMFLLRAQTPAGVVPALPWVHRSGEAQSMSLSATESHFPDGVMTVRNRDDLMRMATAATSAQASGLRLTIQLRPDADLIHDSGFLSELLEILDPDVHVVELPGSSLAHVYYELVRHGLQVRTDDPLSQAEPEAVGFGKLVRDLIPERIAAKGERVRAYRATGAELNVLLRRKLVEESIEVATAESSTALFEELGDVLDVLAALCAVSGTTIEHVMGWAEKKRQDRGGFGHGLVLVETRDRTLEEAIAEGSNDYAVDPAIAAEVEIGRLPVERPEVVRLDDEVTLPIVVQIGESNPTVRMTVSDAQVEVQLTAAGIVVRRIDGSSADPNQLVLKV